MKRIKGFWLPDSDTHFQDHLEKGPEFDGRGTYQFNKIQLALGATAMERRGLALDVGAHVGLWSWVLAHHFGQVVAFEPVCAMADCWRRNMEGASGQVTLIEAAVSDVVGELEMVTEQENSGNSRVRSGSLAPGDETVCATTLDAWWEANGHPRVDLVKVDVEGWEVKVVHGGERMLRACRPTVVVEQKPGHAERYGFGRRDAVRVLESWGAIVSWERAGDVCLRWHDDNRN